MGILDVPALQTSPLSRRHLIAPALQQVSQANNGSGMTFRAATAFRSAPRAVRILFHNGLDVAVTVAKTGAVSLPHLNSTSLSPAVSNEWSIDSTAVVLPAQLGIGVALSQPSATYSPWIMIYPQQAADGTWPVCVTAYIDSTQANYSQNSYDIGWMASNDPLSGQVWKLREQSGDQITNPGTFADQNVRIRGPIAGIEALCADGSVTIMGAGDSAMAGAGATNLGNTDVFRACQNITLAGGTPISFMNSGIGGQNTTTFLTRALYLLPIIKPDVAILAVGSPNDGTPSITGMRLQQFYLQRCIDLARSQGTRVILRGWMPNTSNSWAQGTYTVTPTGTVIGDVYRQQQNLWASQRDGKGLVTWTAGLSMLGNSAQPERYQAAYTTDNNHPNDAGYLAATPNMQAAIQRVLGRFR